MFSPFYAVLSRGRGEDEQLGYTYWRERKKQFGFFSPHSNNSTQCFTALRVLYSYIIIWNNNPYFEGFERKKQNENQNEKQNEKEKEKNLTRP